MPKHNPRAHGFTARATLSRAVAPLLLIALLLTPACTARTSTLDGETLTVALAADFPPYEYVKDGEIVGIDVEIAQIIADRLGLTLILHNTSFSDVFSAVSSGGADIGLSAISVTNFRAKDFLYTDSYARGDLVVLVLIDSPIASSDELRSPDARFKIGVQTDTTSDVYTSRELEESGKALILRYGVLTDALEALYSREVDCVVLDDEPARVFAGDYDGLRILPTDFITEDYAAIIAKNNKALYNAVTPILRELIADGTIAEIIASHTK